MSKNEHILEHNLEKKSTNAVWVIYYFYKWNFMHRGQPQWALMNKFAITLVR